MGLDMWLSKHKKSEPFHTWRKANQIHRYFATEVLETPNFNTEAPIPEESLDELKDRIVKILEDHDLAPKLLPTEDGFFFGDTEYNEYYFENLEDTLAALNNLPELGEDEYYVYGCWW